MLASRYRAMKPRAASSHCRPGGGCSTSIWVALVCAIVPASSDRPEAIAHPEWRRGQVHHALVVARPQTVGSALTGVPDGRRPPDRPSRPDAMSPSGRLAGWTGTPAISQRPCLPGDPVRVAIDGGQCLSPALYALAATPALLQCCPRSGTG